MTSVKACHLTLSGSRADTGYVASKSRNAVPLPENIERRLTLFRAGAALLLCALWGFFAFVKHTEMPVFMFLDIAVHEIGHLLFQPFGELVMLIMGSGWEVAFPFFMGVVFIAWKRDFIAWGVCWAWSANSMADASRYIYDATRGELALLGGTGPDTMGDWERILGRSTSTSSTSLTGSRPTFCTPAWFSGSSPSPS